MNKLANFIEYHRNLGRQQAMLDTGSLTKQADVLSKVLPKSRMGRLALGAGVLGGGIAASKALAPKDQSTLESLYSGGKDMLSNVSQEDLMGYLDLVQSLQQGGGQYGSMGYSAATPSPSDMYAMSDIGDYGSYDPSSSMGYDAQMSPEELQQVMYYHSA